MPDGEKLERKLRTALDETRLLLMGSQILFGFQFNGVFQPLFATLPAASRWLHAASLLCLVITVCLLITPAMQHRIVEQGHCSPRILSVATHAAAAALSFFALAFGADIFIVSGRVFGTAAGAAMGGGFLLLAILFWFVLEFSIRAARQGDRSMRETPLKQEHTPLTTRIEHMLTEARVIIPGAQALFGFQLIVTMTDAFERLPESYKLIHMIAFAAIALAVILLMAPASFHRLAFRGEETEQMHHRLAAYSRRDGAAGHRHQP